MEAETDGGRSNGRYAVQAQPSLSEVSAAVFRDLTGDESFQYRFPKKANTSVENFIDASIFVRTKQSGDLVSDADALVIDFWPFGGFIDPVIQRRLAQLDDFARQHPGEPVSQFVLSLFPDILASQPLNEPSVYAIPKEPPERWTDRGDEQTPGRRKGESPVTFITRVYGEYMGRGLTRAHIRQLDPRLYAALAFWLQKKGNEPPPEFDLPTLKERNDRWVQQVQESGMTVMPTDPREIARLGMAMRRRISSANGKA